LVDLVDEFDELFLLIEVGEEVGFLFGEVRVHGCCCLGFG
jgi:hypothetical protein